MCGSLAADSKLPRDWFGATSLEAFSHLPVGQIWQSDIKNSVVRLG